MSSDVVIMDSMDVRDDGEVTLSITPDVITGDIVAMMSADKGDAGLKPGKHMDDVADPVVEAVTIGTEKTDGDAGVKLGSSVDDKSDVTIGLADITGDDK